MAWRGAPVILALPRGGVPVAYEVARALDAPLDVALVATPEPFFAVGAYYQDFTQTTDSEVIELLSAIRVAKNLFHPARQRH